MINRLTIILTITSLLVIHTIGLSIPQSKSHKAIIRRLTIVKQPVEISFLVNGQPLELTKSVIMAEGTRTEEFEGDSEWLKNLTLNLRNTSGKTITYMQVDLYFPEVTKNGATALSQIFMGVDPDRKFQRAELSLAANERIDLPLSARYDDLKRLVESAHTIPVDNVAKLGVDIHAALFEDGTLFEAGTLFKRNPDPNALQKWIKIETP
jgi:hypothetical protein